MLGELILQGLTNRTHVAALLEMLTLKNIERVLISVAFVSDSGIALIENALKPIADKTIIFAGIRNEITSAQALQRLIKIGVTTYAVDTGSRLLIFHPKLYLVRLSKTAVLSIGSANLTLGGLNNNIEAGVTLRLDMAQADDSKLINALERHLDGLMSSHSKNVLLVTAALVDELVTSGRVVDETIFAPPRLPSTSKTSAVDPTPRMKMLVAPLRKIPSAAKKPTKQQTTKQQISGQKAVHAAATTGVSYELMWVSKELTRRDLNIPLKGRNTNVTGSINLDKGVMEEGVDHRHYFRDVVFSGLSWPAKSGHVDLATGSFAISIKGIDYGTYYLTVRHTTSTTSKTYKQRNAMTRLSWGEARELVQDATLIDRRMALYRDKADPTHFLVSID